MPNKKLVIDKGNNINMIIEEIPSNSKIGKNTDLIYSLEDVQNEISQGIISNSFSALEASSSDDDDEKKKEEETDTSEDYPPSIEGTVARMVCRVLNIHPAADEGHHLIVAQIEKAKVLKSYFSEGKFSPKGTAMRMESLPRLLTFLGGQTFGAVDADETKVVVQKSK